MEDFAVDEPAVAMDVELSGGEEVAAQDFMMAAEPQDAPMASVSAAESIGASLAAGGGARTPSPIRKWREEHEQALDVLRRNAEEAAEARKATGKEDLEKVSILRERGRERERGDGGWFSAHTPEEGERGGGERRMRDV